MPSTLSLGVLGGTGPEGKALAVRFGRAGCKVRIGSRSAERAREVASSLCTGSGLNSISGCDNREMIESSDLIFLTVPYQEAASALGLYRDAFKPGSILIDTVVPILFGKQGPSYVELEAGSASESLAALLPDGVQLVGAFKTIPTHLLEEDQVPLDCDAFVYGEGAEARGRVMEIMRMLPGLRPVDAGGIRAARTVERMTVLAISLNRRYKVRTARFRVVGLP